MLSERELSAAIGSAVYGTDGDKIGTVEHFFADDRTGTPTWVAVMTGLFGTRQSIAPAVDATFDDGSLRLPVSKEAVKSAPHMAGDHLDPAEEAALREHYGLGTLGEHDGPGTLREHDRLETTSGTGRDGGRHAAPDIGDTTADRRTDTVVVGTVGTEATRTVAETPPPTTRDAPTPDGAMTRSEEQLRVGTEQVATTRARLVKYVVTEEVQITVPIRREEIRVEQVPIDAPDDGPGESLVDAGEAYPSAGRAGGAPAGVGGGLPEEIVLHTERPVVTVEVVPVERVRLRTEVVQGQETVTEQVQREQIVVDEDRVAPRTT